MKMTCSALQVVRWFLNHVRELINEKDEEPLSVSKLQKLLYFAQGTSLSLSGKPLFSEWIVCKNHRPAILLVEQFYGFSQGGPIVFDENYNESLNAAVQNLLNTVYNTFGCYSAWAWTS